MFGISTTIVNLLVILLDQQVLHLIGGFLYMPQRYREFKRCHQKGGLWVEKGFCENLHTRRFPTGHQTSMYKQLLPAPILSSHSSHLQLLNYLLI
jgi:hypothetical protein